MAEWPVQELVKEQMAVRSMRNMPAVMPVDSQGHVPGPPRSGSSWNITIVITEILAVPGVAEAQSHSKWPSRGLSSGTTDPKRLACLGIRGEGGAPHAIKHTKQFLGGLAGPMLY